MSKEFTESIGRFLSLLEARERGKIAVECGLSADCSSDQIIDAVSDLPRYEVVRLILIAAGPTLQMLQQIFSTLEHFDIAVRTTGCVFMLERPIKKKGGESLELSKQTVELLSDFASVSDWSKLDAQLQELQGRWRRFLPIWQRLLSDAKPRVYRGELDVVESYIERRTVYEPDRDFTDKGAQAVFTYLVGKVTDLVEKLETATFNVKNGHTQCRELLED